MEWTLPPSTLAAKLSHRRLAWLLVSLVVCAALASSASAQVPLNPRLLTKYVDPLPIPPAMPPAGLNYYEITAAPTVQQLHSQLPPTLVWGYGPDPASVTFPARTIEATRGVPVWVQWVNGLNGVMHPMPVDQTLHWADPLMEMPSFDPYTGPVPLVPHLHGGEVPSWSDGHPDAWWTPGLAQAGPAFVTDLYWYPNAQPPTTLWYHDHALGVTRLNVYMGLAGFYLLRDPAVEAALNLPGPAPQLGDPPGMSYYEIPLVIQDRMFDVNGQLLYPSIGVNPLIHPYWIPEFFGDTILVNGKVWPYLDVEPRKYRFRVLNGSNARFYLMSFDNEMVFWQIGTDGGYLPAPVPMTSLLIAPGERCDIVVDFSGLPVGTQLVLRNRGKIPYPNGAPADPQTSGQIMRFNVTPLTAPDTSSLPAALVPVNPLNPLGAPVRILTLNEVMGPAGPIMALLDGKKWDAAVSETPVVGSTEVWQVVNLTGDTHPIHLHLVQFQLVNRQKFNVNKYGAAYMALNPVIPVPDGVPYTPVDPTPYLLGTPRAPDPNEAGWKDTFRMNPGEVTTVVVRFAPSGPPVVTPFPFDPTVGPGYVWHCHILEHEDNEMMRPYQLVW